MKTVLIVAMSAALAACSGKDTPANGAGSADSAVAEVKTIADVPAAQGRTDSEEAAVDDVENFATFFDKFKTDSAFQKERMKFPLKVLRTEYPEYPALRPAYEVTTISRDKMGYLHFLDDGIFQYAECRVGEDEELVTVSLDSDMLASYLFRAYEGKWYLAVKSDESM